MERVQIIPGNNGKNCPANGKDPLIECGCDECDYLMCCIGTSSQECTKKCEDKNCPRKTAP